MINANRPVTPIEREIIDTSGDFIGLTKREHFAGLAMQGILADSQTDEGSESIARAAVRIADALLKELSNAS